MRIEKVSYSAAARKMLGKSRQPRLDGLTLDGRLAVIVSDLALTPMLLGRSPAGVEGYEPDAAYAIVRNIIAMVSDAASADANQAQARSP
jgi:hypothetical protein